MTVAPLADELLSSWLHRLALANGVAPRHFGDVLGLGAGMWSARLDLALPDGTLDVLHKHTRVARDRLAMMTFGADPGSRLLLPLHRLVRRKASTWLQFCPRCLAADEAPYFRRSWRWATRISCFEHGCGLRDRCPGCGDAIAAFAQRDLIAQHFCSSCGDDLRSAPRVRLLAATRRKAKVIDDLCRFEAAKGFTARSSLTQRLITSAARHLCCRSSRSDAIIRSGPDWLHRSHRRGLDPAARRRGRRHRALATTDRSRRWHCRNPRTFVSADRWLPRNASCRF